MTYAEFQRSFKVNLRDLAPRGRLIGGNRVAETSWEIPFEVTEADITEQLLATPEHAYEACGGLYPTRERGSIWWWVSVDCELGPIHLC